MWIFDEPDKIDLLPELTDCPALRELVTALNAPTGSFETYGCEKWIGAWANDAFPGYGFRQGSYVDVWSMRSVGGGRPWSISRAFY